MENTIILTGHAFIGNANDFDAWVRYVAAHIDAATGLDWEIANFGYGEGPASDEISTDGDVAEIQEIVESLWGDFCAEGNAK